MTYMRSNKEVIVIMNDNEKTRKLANAVQDYLWDLLENVKIQYLDDFALKLDCDGINVFGIIEKDDNGYRISLRSAEENQDKGMYMGLC